MHALISTHTQKLIKQFRVLRRVQNNISVIYTWLTCIQDEITCYCHGVIIFSSCNSTYNVSVTKTAMNIMSMNL